MNNNQNNPQEVPQVKSVDTMSVYFIIEDYDYEGFSAPINDQGHLSETDANSICDKLNAKKRNKPFEVASIEVENIFQSRISELENQNAKLREALYSIIGYPSYSNHKIHEPLKAIAEQALNSKEG